MGKRIESILGNERSSLSIVSLTCQSFVSSHLNIGQLDHFLKLCLANFEAINEIYIKK